MQGTAKVATAVPTTVTLIVSGPGQALAPRLMSQVKVLLAPGSRLNGTVGSTSQPLRVTSPERASVTFTLTVACPLLLTVRMNPPLRVVGTMPDGINR